MAAAQLHDALVLEPGQVATVTLPGGLVVQVTNTGTETQALRLRRYSRTSLVRAGLVEAVRSVWRRGGAWRAS